MKVYDVLTNGVMECLNSTKYKSPNTRRFDICNRYNSAISHVLQISREANELIDPVGCARVKGAKGFITKSICDSLSDEELYEYITEHVFPILQNMFRDMSC